MVAGERETEAHGLASPERALCLERREEVGKTRPSISLIACGARACRARRSLPLSARPHALPHPTSDRPPPPFLAVCDAPSRPVTREWQNARVSPTLATETNVTHSLSLSLLRPGARATPNTRRRRPLQVAVASLSREACCCEAPVRGRAGPHTRLTSSPLVSLFSLLPGPLPRRPSPPGPRGPRPVSSLGRPPRQRGPDG